MSDNKYKQHEVRTDIEALLVSIDCEDMAYKEVTADQRLDKVVAKWPLLQELNRLAEQRDEA